MGIPDGYRKITYNDVGKTFGVDLETVIKFDEAISVGNWYVTATQPFNEIEWIRFSDTSYFYSYRWENENLWMVETFFRGHTQSVTERTFPYPEDHITSTSETVPSGTAIMNIWTSDTIWMNYVYVKDIEYTIIFDGKGGTYPDFQRTTNQKLTTLPNSTRTGYRFLGWYTEISGGEEITTSKIFSEDTTVYAQWERKEYTLYFSHGGFDSSTVTYNEPYNRYELDSKPYSIEGYTWVGWYDASIGGNEITSTSLVKVDTINNYIYAYARWTQDPPYTITFEPNGGKRIIQAETLKRETEGTFPFMVASDFPEVEKTDFSFEGWYLDNESFLEEATSSVTHFYSNTTVYAKWHWQPKKGYKDFSFRNKLLSEFNGFIINGGDDLKFFNPSNFSHEFTTPQFSNRSFLTGTSRENREFNFNIFLQEVDLEQYKDFLDWLNPEYKGVLILSYNTDYGYDVKVNSISEATFYVCRECKTDKTVDKYNIELEIGFITEKDWAARKLKEEPTLGNRVELRENNFRPYHGIINKQNLENYLIIKFQKSLEIIWHAYEEGGEGRGPYSIVNIVNESPGLSATYYSQYGIAILEDGNFLGGTIVPLVIPPRTSIDKYLIKIDNSEAEDGSIEMTSREII